jgi:hypothetical protein
MTPCETNGPYSFTPRSRTLQNGVTDSDFAGKPRVSNAR